MSDTVDFLIARLRKQYTEQRPVVMEDFPDARHVFLRVGPQSFCVTPHGCENAEQADWTQNMLARALATLIRENLDAEDCRKALLSQEATIERQAASLATVELERNMARANHKAASRMLDDQIAITERECERAEAAEAGLASARQTLLEVDNWVVCAAITSPEDFQQGAAGTHELIERALSSPRQEATG